MHLNYFIEILNIIDI